MSENSEDQIVGLIVHAEKLQQETAQEVKRVVDAARDILESLPKITTTMIRDTIQQSAGNIFSPIAQNVSTDILETARTVENAGIRLGHTWLSQGLFLAAVVLALMGVMYFGSGNMIKSRISELEGVEVSIKAARAALDALESKTWGVELKDFGKGERWIILPKGVKFDPTAGNMSDGREAIKLLKP